jgi:hypothetical protein
MTIFEKLKAGQRVFVVNPDTGKEFSIEPAYWEGIRLGWTFRNADGDISPQHNGIMASNADIKDCCDQLVERSAPGVVVEWKTSAMKGSAFWHYHARCLPEKYKVNGKDVRFAEAIGVTCIACNELI